MVEKELRVDGILYLLMKDGETQAEAEMRLFDLIDGVDGLCLNGNYEARVQET